MTDMNIFDIQDIRGYIFSYLYPKLIKPGMVMQYMGSAVPKKYLNNYIGKLFIIDNYIRIFFNNNLHLEVIVMARGIDTINCIFFPEEDYIKIISV